MKPENLPPVTRMIVRSVAFGLSDDDIIVRFPEFTTVQIAKMRAGTTFKRALAEMQTAIDQELVEHAAADPVRAYLAGKGLSAAQTLNRLASNADAETPHSVQAKAADSILSKAGYGSQVENIAVPVLMLSPEKLAAVMARPDVLASVPDSVDSTNLKDL